MVEDLLPAFEKSLLESSGSIPVVFEGVEHCYETSTPFPTASRHTSHELLYLRRGKCEFVINGKTVNDEYLSKGNPDYLFNHETFGNELQLAVQELDKLMER